MTTRIANIALSAGAGSLIFALAACSQQPGSSENYVPAETPRGDSLYRDVVALRTDQGPVAAPMAVTHGFRLRLPNDAIEATQRRHLDECTKLGCVVINTRLTRTERGRVFANSSIRIRRDNFEAFAKVLASPPAEIISRTQSADDKPIPLRDEEKRIELKMVLRDRLEAMLKDPGTKSAADLLAIEKELTQVQGDIESATAQRDYLRTLTDTVRVDVSYEGTGVLTAGIDFYPIREAVMAIGRTFTWSVAELITFLAAALPWIPLVALLAWVLRRAIRRRRSAST